MTIDYARFKATGDRLVGGGGQAGFVRRPGTSTGPAHNPTIGAPVNHPATFIVTDYRSREIDGTRIQTGDKRVAMAVGSLTITPSTTDLLVDASGQVYKIVDCKPVDPAGTVIFFKLQVRR